MSLIVPLKIVEAVTLIEDSMDKLQQYGEELAETCHKHFPDLKRRVPKFTRRESSSVEKLKNSSQKQVRVFLVLFFHTNPSNTVKYCVVFKLMSMYVGASISKWSFTCVRFADLFFG